MMEQGKDLPPLTLSNTSVSCLVTLIPVLVSMTSHGEIPSYEDETDKPAWWPSDIQWRNPKLYVQEAKKKDDGLKVLRKLVYSCYSYHGVEDLLCRLDETPFSDSEVESGENMDISQLGEDSEDIQEDSSAESEGPVFVCCFCLDQFSNHEAVTVHQYECSKRFRETTSESLTVKVDGNTEIDSTTMPSSLEDSSIEFFLGPAECPASPLDSTSDFPNKIMDSSSASSLSYNLSKAPLDNIRKTSSSTSSNQLPPVSHISAGVPSASNKRQATTTYVPFVPTLKTRSQKRLDQIMERHNLRRLMHQECREMKDVPKTGAWWVRKTRRKCNIPFQHPNTYLSQNAFTSGLGLARSTDVAAMVNSGSKSEKEVDLDCEIVSVEGPISAVPTALPPPAAVEKLTSASPRSTRSLMSQLSRDSEVNTRRRLSFCFVEDEWADKEALNEGRDPLQTSLLTLDFSSPLGQRVKKYVRGEGHLNIIKDGESYCRTEIDEDGYSKLRYRGYDFRVTYRKKRRSSHYVHKYKFNKSDREEFKTLLRTGLSAYSRRLQHCLPECRVVLYKLSKSKIKLWTQEKKITISEKIVFDDDICITQIDIPESKTVQGFTPESHSPSHHHLYRQTQHLAPGALSSPLPLGRMNTSSDSRSLFSPRMSASPPHIPNIFRSRASSNTPSPPRPNITRPQNVASGWRPNITRPQNVPSGWTPQKQINNDKKNFVEQGHSRFNNSSSMENSSSQHKMFDRSSQHLAHLSGHISLTPSAYMVLDRSKGGGDLGSNSNRRKQQLTQVRKDESDEGEPQSSASATRRLTVMGHDTCNPQSRSHIENHHSDAKQKHGLYSSASRNKALSESRNHALTESRNRALPESRNHALPPSTRRLSNFDYFSIRDGKIQPAYTNSNHAVVSQHRASTSSSSLGHSHNHQKLGLSQRASQNHQKLGLSQQTSQNNQKFGLSQQISHHPRQNHHSQPLSSATSHSQPHHQHHHNSHTSQPAPGQVRLNTINTSQESHSVYSSGSPQETFSVNRYGDITPRLQTLKKGSTEKAVLRHLNNNPLSEDDDVMEIICIDDD